MDVFLRNQITLARLYSYTYYDISQFWSNVASGLGGTGIALGASVLILSNILNYLTFTPSQINIAMSITGSCVSTISGIITYMKAGNKQQDNQSAGDSYKKLADDFSTKLSIVKTNNLSGDAEKAAIDTLLEEFNKVRNELTDKYDEPDYKVIKKLCDEYQINILLPV